MSARLGGAHKRYRPRRIDPVRFSPVSVPKTADRRQRGELLSGDRGRLDDLIGLPSTISRKQFAVLTAAVSGCSARQI